MSTLGDVLRFAGVPERFGDPARERFVTVRLHGGGAVQRVLGAGKHPVPFTGYRIHRGQLIYSRIDARNGAFALVPAVLDGAVVSKDFPIFDIRTDLVEPSYLSHFFRAGTLQRDIRAASFGATNRQRIAEDRLLSYTIPLPSLPEQRRIAAILDQAGGLREERRQTLTLLDDLPLVIFREMFGDPTATDPMVPREPIGALAEVVTGNTPPRSQPENFGDEIEWIKSDNLGSDTATLADEYLSARGRQRARVVPAGSLLVTCIAGSQNSIGKSSMVDREVAFNQQINAIVPGPRLDSHFLLGQLKTAPELVRAKSSGGMKGLVSKSSFQAIQILVPTLARQHEFANRVLSISAQRGVAQSSLDLLDELFDSLQARAFSGRL